GRWAVRRGGAAAGVLRWGGGAGFPCGPRLMGDDGEPSPGLLLTLDVDAPLERPLEELVDLGAEGLDRVFCHCEGYPLPDSLVPATRLSYLRAHLVDVTVFYAHVVGRSLEQVRQEARLRDAIEDHLDHLDRDEPEWRSRGPLEVRAAVRAFVEGDPSLAWALEPPAAPEPAFRR